MKYKTFMIIYSVVGLLFGLSFFLAPAWTEASYGVNLDAGGQLMARFMGSAYLGLAVIIWLVRNIISPELRRPVLAGMLVASTLGLVLGIYDRIMGIENALAWSTVLIFLLMSIGSGYYTFKPDAA
ncbi:MAG TPA: hypothetical protein VGK00_02175 [Anaerolineales bacterium]|jgi:hypothetical protein